jgi:CBS domain-containing protein
MKIEALMTPKVETITPDARSKEAARKMHDLHIGSLPVIEGGKLLGIITDRDICCRVIATGHDAVSTLVNEVMTKEVTTCYADQDIDEAAQIMMDHKIHRLAVLNRDESMAGFVSVEDLARCSHELAGDVLKAAAPAQH